MAEAVTVESFGRPRIKPEHRAYRTVDGNVRVGSVIHGIGAEIADPQGWVWTLVEAMDGSRGPSEVVAEVLRSHPDLPGEDARQAMADLLAAGFVDDARASVPVPPREEDRYSRGVPLLRWMDLGPRTSPWDAQLRLREARVLLIGVGGTGGHAAQALVASGVGHVHCVDPDVVELSNLNRQPLYRESDLGRPKVEAAVATLRALNSDVWVTGERREVARPEDLAELVAGSRQAGRPPGGPPSVSAAGRGATGAEHRRPGGPPDLPTRRPRPPTGPGERSPRRHPPLLSRRPPTTSSSSPPTARTRSGGGPTGPVWRPGCPGSTPDTGALSSPPVCTCPGGGPAGSVCGTGRSPGGICGSGRDRTRRSPRRGCRGTRRVPSPPGSREPCSRTPPSPC